MNSPTRKVPSGASELGDGIVVGAGPVTVDAYEDFLCPFCRLFEQTAAPLLDELVDAGAISLVRHPMAFLDELSTTRYSTRAAAASACAADQGRFAAYARALFAEQPPEGGPGLGDDQLIELGRRAAGLDEEGFGACVRSGAYLDWAGYVTALAVERGVSATPTVFVAGSPVPANPETIRLAVRASLR
ncbi:DsbA family protein [Actinomadura sp. ATCC 31491]|uniref:DsbA family protein n=1 Tax=Actinomadura luzonensis TaxID=2805427 RepID=A0ABT0G9P7_9ACTN|nr:thioredoxin domain-containing protein [Actinomadura luzonensis]MCK2221330.1 DsbA family protein [Actinomadura luzonensis]